MPLINHTQLELHLKIVYYGPGLGGKTTNLEYLHRTSKPERRGRLISLNTESERTLFFDLLPVELGEFRGYTVRLHLCTVPGQIAHDETRRLVLRNVDGVVFVVDSQAESVEANVASMRNLDTNLRLHGYDPERIPLVVQYNKRDLTTALPVMLLRDVLSIPAGVPGIEARARQGVGVAETLKDITKLCLSLVPEPKVVKEGRSPSMLPGRRPSMFPGAIPPASAASSVPGAEYAHIPLSQSAEGP